MARKPVAGKELRAPGTKKWSVWSRAVIRRVDVRSRSCQIFSIWVDCGRRVEVTAGTFVFNRGEIWLSNFSKPGICRAAVVGKGSASSGRLFRCCLPGVSVYFEYFLDPDQ